MLQDRFYFRRKDQESIDDGIKQRANRKLIARQEKRAVSSIVDSEGKLSIQPVEKANAVLFVKMDQHFDVCFRPESVALLFEFLRQLAVIENLAVTTQNQITIFIEQRLITCLQIDDSQATRAQTGIGLDKIAT